MKGTVTSRSSAERDRGRHGFTLLEVMVAVAVIAFAFVGLLGLQGRNIAVTSRIDHFSRATLLARETMTQMQFEDYESIEDGGGTFEWYPEFRWERVVTETALDNVKMIRLRIIWDDNMPNACELVYFMYDPNL